MNCALLEFPAPPLGAWLPFDEYVDNYLSEHSDFLNEECAQQAEWLAYASSGEYSIDADLAVLAGGGSFLAGFDCLFLCH